MFIIRENLGHPVMDVSRLRVVESSGLSLFRTQLSGGIQRWMTKILADYVDVCNQGKYSLSCNGCLQTSCGRVVWIISLPDTTFWSHSSQDEEDFRGLRLVMLLTVVTLYFLLSANSSESYSRDI